MKPIALLSTVASAALATASMDAQTVAPAYASDYSAVNLGAPPGVPANLGGAILEAGSPDTLLVGGAANGGAGAIYAVGLTRGAGGHITGFTGSVSLFASAPYIDGGLAYGPGGDLFFTEYPVNQLGEIKPGDTSPDATIDLSSVGIAGSVGGLQFVPAGSPGAGEFKIVSYNAGTWYTASLVPDGTGTYNIGAVSSPITIGGGPEGVAYVPTGSADFGSPSVLVSDYSTGDVEAYQVDSNGDPIPASAQAFVTGLTGAEGAFIDPLTGDYIFSTYGGGNHIEEIQGFVAPPSVPDTSSTLLLLSLPAGLLAGIRRFTRR